MQIADPRAAPPGCDRRCRWPGRRRPSPAAQRTAADDIARRHRERRNRPRQENLASHSIASELCDTHCRQALCVSQMNGGRSNILTPNHALLVVEVALRVIDDEFGLSESYRLERNKLPSQL